MQRKIWGIALVMVLLSCSSRSTTHPTTPVSIVVSQDDTQSAENTSHRVICDPRSTHDQPAEREVDGDADRDGHDDWVDICPNSYDPDQFDRDGDGFGDACDRCPATAGPHTQTGCPNDEIPCDKPCTETQKCDMRIGTCVDLPKPPPKPSPRFDHLPPVEACHKYCDVFSDCDEIGKACGEPGRKDMRARCHTMCETNARGRDHLLTIGPSGCASAATLQVYVGMSIECVCGGQYCPMVMKNCSEDDPIFKSDQECYDTCNAYPQLGSGGSKTGNNVRCRIYHAYNNDNPGACENASPSGGTACVQ